MTWPCSYVIWALLERPNICEPTLFKFYKFFPRVKVSSIGSRCDFFFFFKSRGTWVVQSFERLTLGFGLRS